MVSMCRGNQKHLRSDAVRKYLLLMHVNISSSMLKLLGKFVIQSTIKIKQTYSISLYIVQELPAEPPCAFLSHQLCILTVNIPITSIGYASMSF